jgi:hypothetical protein
MQLPARAPSRDCGQASWHNKGGRQPLQQLVGICTSACEQVQSSMQNKCRYKTLFCETFISSSGVISHISTCCTLSDSRSITYYQLRKLGSTLLQSTSIPICICALPSLLTDIVTNNGRSLFPAAATLAHRITHSESTLSSTPHHTSTTSTATMCS